MTSFAGPADLSLPSPRRSRLAWAAADSLAIAQRNVIGMTRRPQLLAFVTIQPVLFVLMFRYVFGGSIRVAGTSYTNYLMAGIFVTTVLFGAQNTAIGMAEDLHNGLLERFRSLVMARSAVLAGRVLADALRNVFVIALMVGVGYLVGFRLNTNAAALVAAAGVLLLFGFAISWVTALLGMAAKSAEAAGAAALPLTVLLTFPSSAFVSTANMPGPLRAYADHQPLTATVNAVRPLLLGGPTAAHAVAAIIWCAGVVAVFAPLSVLRYRRIRLCAGQFARWVLAVAPVPVERKRSGFDLPAPRGLRIAASATTGSSPVSAVGKPAWGVSEPQEHGVEPDQA